MTPPRCPYALLSQRTAIFTLCIIGLVWILYRIVSTLAMLSDTMPLWDWREFSNLMQRGGSIFYAEFITLYVGIAASIFGIALIALMVEIGWIIFAIVLSALLVDAMTQMYLRPSMNTFLETKLWRFIVFLLIVGLVNVAFSLLT